MMGASSLLLRQATLFAATYFACAEVGRWLTIGPDHITTFWPPSGFYMAVLLRSEIRRWPIFLVAALVGSAASDVLLHEKPVLVALGFWLASSLGACVGASLVRLQYGGASSEKRLLGVLIFVLFAAIVSPLFSATIGAAIVAAAAEGPDYSTAWFGWCAGDAVGILVVGPVVDQFLRPQPSAWFRQARLIGVIEWIGTVVVVGTITQVIFSRTRSVPLAHLVFPFLLWPALRFGSRGAVVAVLTLAVVAVRNTANGRGPFGAGEFSEWEQVGLVQAFVSSCALTAFVLAAVVSERQRALDALAAANAELESRVNERTEDLVHAIEISHASEERYRLLTDAMPHGVWTMRPDLTLVYHNRRSFEFTGLSVEEVNATNWANLVHPDDLPKTLEATTGAMARGEPYEAEYRFLSHTGEYRWVVSRAVPLKNDAGAVVEWVGCTNEVHDRRLAEERVRHGERRYRALVEATPQVVWTLGGDVNEVRNWWTELTGQPPTESEGLGWLAAVHPDDRERVRATWAHAFETLSLYDTEYRIRTRTGAYRDFVVRGVALSDTAGNLLEWIGTLTDITEKKQAEIALRESERRYRAMFNHSAVAMWEEDFSAVQTYLDSLGVRGGPTMRAYLEAHPEVIRTAAGLVRITGINEQCLRLHGATSREELLASLSETFVDESFDVFREELIALAEGRRVFEAESPLRTLQGDRRHALVTIVVPQDVTTDSVFVGLTDITDRKRVEEQLRELNATLEQRVDERTKALKEQEERFRSAFEHAPIGIGLVAPDGRWLRVNRSLCEIVGYSESELLAIYFQQITHPDDLEADLGLARDMLASRIRTYQREKRYFHKEGHIVHALLSVSLVRDDRGEPLYFISQIKDNTQRKEAEERIKASLREKEVLLKEIHHRVKNNLQIVSTLLDLQSDHTRDPQAIEMFEESRGRVKSMAFIHERLYRSQDLSRVDFTEYISQLADDLYHSYKVSGDEIALEVAVDVPPLPIDIAIPCGLLLNELMSNCLKHAFRDGTEGRIRVSLRGVGADSIVLTVADDGAGFPSDLDFRDTSSFGMQLVITLVEQLNGVVELVNARGTEFSVTFPHKR